MSNYKKQIPRLSRSQKNKIKSFVSTKQGKTAVAVLLILVIVSAVLAVVFPSQTRQVFERLGIIEKQTELPKDGYAEFHFIDVGQGDAALIITDEVHVLVDCGTYEQSSTVIEYVKQYTDEIDLFVFSHAHDDHMGGAASVIRALDVKEVMMTEYDSDLAFYSRATEAIDECEVDINIVTAGDTYSVGDVKIDVFAPGKDYNDHNNNSIVMKLEADGASVMFTGDAEGAAERDVMESYADKLKCDILKVGHHGSSSSTTEEFLAAVDPDFAVVSCGKDNSYGHPHREIREMFDEADFDWYRTDEDGTVVLVLEDGKIKKK